MQNTGIAAVAPQGAQQSVPSIPQEMQPRPQGGVSTGIAPPMGNLDKRTLAMAVLGQVPGVEPAAALGRLNKMVEAEKMQQAMAGQQAMAQNSAMQQQPPVAQQVLAQAMNSGIGAQPYGYASGGIVAFADGGLTENPFPANGQEMQRLGREFGIDVSIYDPPEVRAAKFARIKEMTDFNRFMEQNRAEIPVDPALARRDPTARVGTEKGRATNRNQITYTPPVQAAPMPPKPPAPPRPGASPRAAAPVAPAAPNMLDTANQQYLEALGASAGITQEERSAREQLRKQLEEVQKQRLARQEKLEGDLAARRAAMGQRPSGFKDPDFLLKLAAAMGSTKTASEGFAKASESISNYGANRRKEEEEAAREMRREGMDLMKLRDANEDLKTALYEKDLAYASGDANAKRAADLKVAEARANFAAAERAYALEKYKAESGRMAAEASHTAAAQRGEGRGKLTPYQISQIYDRAVDNVNKDFAMKAAQERNKAIKEKRPFDEEAYRKQLINAEIQAVARAMGYELPSLPSASTQPPLGPGWGKATVTSQ